MIANLWNEYIEDDSPETLFTVYHHPAERRAWGVVAVKENLALDVWIVATLNKASEKGATGGKGVSPGGLEPLSPRENWFSVDCSMKEKETWAGVAEAMGQTPEAWAVSILNCKAGFKV